ncbi:MAG: hypothetical protein ACOYI6_09460 [Christensenellales bacterium]|jgi:hypothetical protein
MKRKALLILMVLSVSAILAACTQSNPQREPVAPTATAVSQAQPQPAQQLVEGAFGQSQQVEGVTIKLLSTVQSRGEGNYSADAGQVFVQPRFEINNQSTKGTKIAIAFNYFVDGVSMPEDTAAVQSADGGALGTTLEFGESITGFSGVRAPENWQQIKVHYSPHIIGDEAEFVIKRSDLP